MVTFMKKELTSPCNIEYLPIYVKENVLMLSFKKCCHYAEAGSQSKCNYMEEILS